MIASAFAARHEMISSRRGIGYLFQTILTLSVIDCIELTQIDWSCLFLWTLCMATKIARHNHYRRNCPSRVYASQRRRFFWHLVVVCVPACPVMDVSIVVIGLYAVDDEVSHRTSSREKPTRLKSSREYECRLCAWSDERHQSQRSLKPPPCARTVSLQ